MQNAMFQKCVSLLSSETDSLRAMGMTVVGSAVGGDRRHAEILSDFLINGTKEPQTRNQTLQALEYLAKHTNANDSCQVLFEHLIQTVITTTTDDSTLSQKLSLSAVPAGSHTIPLLVSTIQSEQLPLHVRELCSSVLRHSNYSYDAIPKDVKDNVYHTPSKSIGCALLLAASGNECSHRELILDKLYNMIRYAMSSSTESPGIEVYSEGTSERVSSSKLPRARQVVESCSSETSELLKIIVNSVVENVNIDSSLMSINNALKMVIELLLWNGLQTHRDDEKEETVVDKIFHLDDHDYDLSSSSSSSCSSDVESESPTETQDDETPTVVSSPTSAKHAASRQAAAKALSAFVGLLINHTDFEAHRTFQQHIQSGAIQQVFNDPCPTVRMYSLQAFSQLTHTVRQQVTRLLELEKSRILPLGTVRSRIDEWHQTVSGTELIKPICLQAQIAVRDDDMTLLNQCMEVLGGVIEVQSMLAIKSDRSNLRCAQILATLSHVMTNVDVDVDERLVENIRNLIAKVCRQSLTSLPPRSLRGYICELAFELLSVDPSSISSLAETHRLCLSLSARGRFFSALVTSFENNPSELANIMSGKALTFIPYDSLRKGLIDVVSSLNDPNHKHKTLISLGSSHTSQVMKQLTATLINNVVSSSIAVLKDLRSGFVDFNGFGDGMTSKERLMLVRTSALNVLEQALSCGKKISSIHLKHAVRELQPFLSPQSSHWEHALPLCADAISVCKAYNNKHTLSQYVSALVFPRCVDLVRCGCGEAALERFFMSLGRSHRHATSSVAFDLFALANVVSLSVGVYIKVPTFARALASQQNIPLGSSMDSRLSFMTSNSVGCPEITCSYICDDPMWDQFVADCTTDPPKFAPSNYLTAGRLIAKIIAVEEEPPSADPYSPEQHYYETVCMTSLSQPSQQSEQSICLAISILNHSHATVDKQQLLSNLKGILTSKKTSTAAKALASCCSYELLSKETANPDVGKLLSEIGLNFDCQNTTLYLEQVELLTSYVSEPVLVGIVEKLVSADCGEAAAKIVANTVLTTNTSIPPGIIFEKILRNMHRESSGEGRQLFLVKILKHVVLNLRNGQDHKLFHHTVESIKSLIQVTSSNTIQQTLLLITNTLDGMCDQLLVHLAFALDSILATKSQPITVCDTPPNANEHFDPEIEDEINNIFGTSSPVVDLTDKFKGTLTALRDKVVVVADEEITIKNLVESEKGK